MSQSAHTWWGIVDVEPGQTRQWRLASLDLRVHRKDGEWQVEWAWEDDAEDERRFSLVTTRDALPETGELARFVEPDNRLDIEPALADRSVVVRPRVQLNVPPRRDARVYVSSPLWLEASVPNGGLLWSLPIHRPADTWLGPSTREGELAYALRTRARLNFDDLTNLPHRAITPVVVRNRSEAKLLVERLNLPVPLLSVFATAEGELWTEEAVLVHRDTTSGLAALEVSPGPPREATGATRLNGPRELPDHNRLVRAFSSILQPFSELGF